MFNLSSIKAINFAFKDTEPEITISQLGQGWVAEEALAIAIYCSIKETDFKKALSLAVNHDGDNDFTGSICGNILSAHFGISSLPLIYYN